MRFFNLDCHISVIEDLKLIFASIGHTIDSWSISGHNWVLGRQAALPEVINADSWRSLDQQMINRFNDKYRSTLSSYDGFVCTYPPAFAQIFAEYKKPIIVHIPIRYEVPYSNNSSKWHSLNRFLVDGIANGQIIVTANSIYDQKYFAAFTGISPIHIPSLCEYAGYRYAPKNDCFLLSSRIGISIPNLVNISSLGRYKWSDLAAYKGVVVIPYNASQMSIFEYYTACMPMFAPSIEFLSSLMYDHRDQVMAELSWNKIFGLPPSSVISPFGPDPNNYVNLDIMHEWAAYSDIYDEQNMPYITYFDNFRDLEHKLSQINLQAISGLMRLFNKEKKQRVINSWKYILDTL